MNQTYKSNQHHTRNKIYNNDKRDGDLLQENERKKKTKLNIKMKMK